MRFGIDLGGTKIEIAALGADGAVAWRERTATPAGDYAATIRALRDLVREAEAATGRRGTVGVAIPGSISARSGLVKNANSTCLIGHPLDRDLADALGRPVRLANDANCFALSEAADGAGKDNRTVFGIIAGTGIGGGVVVDGRVLTGANGIAGEWGHNPLPAASAEELPGPACYCGKRGCIETWLSGPALTRQHRARSGHELMGTEIAAAAAQGDPLAVATMQDFFDRFARSVAVVVNILDPDVIVLGGGLSNIAALYHELPERIRAYAFTPEGPARVLRNVHGDSSGVRGAAWLWSIADAAAATPE